MNTRLINTLKGLKQDAASLAFKLEQAVADDLDGNDLSDPAEQMADALRSFASEVEDEVTSLEEADAEEDEEDNE